MKDLRHPIPDWVSRGKTIRQLIQELQRFENQDAIVRMSIDYGDSHCGISIVHKVGEQCVLVNCEQYYENEWQDFKDGQEGLDA
jgi:hypothetical protein